MLNIIGFTILTPAFAVRCHISKDCTCSDPSQSECEQAKCDIYDETNENNLCCQYNSTGALIYPGCQGTCNNIPIQCNQNRQSGGQGRTEYKVNMGATAGTFVGSYQMYSVPDLLNITYVYDGKEDLVYTTGTYVSGSRQFTASFGPGSSEELTVVVDAPTPGTAWDVVINCPRNTSIVPTSSPTNPPTQAPTTRPPTPNPTRPPTQAPTKSPTARPSANPSTSPTHLPSPNPSFTARPSSLESSTIPSNQPTISISPTNQPTPDQSFSYSYGFSFEYSTSLDRKKRNSQQEKAKRSRRRKRLTRG